MPMLKDILLLRVYLDGKTTNKFKSVISITWSNLQNVYATTKFSAIFTNYLITLIAREIGTI